MNGPPNSSAKETAIEANGSHNGPARDAGPKASAPPNGPARDAGPKGAPFPLSLAAGLANDFWGTLGRWEEGRALWVLGGLSALGLEIFSYVFFQAFLGLKPCEYCVLIRLAMLGLALGGFLGAAYPRSLLAKLPGYAVALGFSAWGLHLSLALEYINLEAALDPNFFSPCGSGAMDFPLGIPFDAMLPSHFLPSGVCGEDSRWALFDFSMTQQLIMIYVVYIVGLLLMLAAGILKSRKARAPKAAAA